MPDFVRQALAKLSIAVSLLLASCSEPADGPPQPTVLLDGLFDEWTEAATLIDDPPDALDAAVDVLSVQALDDEHWLYLALDVGNEVSLQGLPGALHLLLDVDADRGTGGSLYGMDGVDLVVGLADEVLPQSNLDRGIGFRLRAFDYRGELETVPRHSLRLMAAPTWSAPRFELRLARRGENGAPSLEEGLRLKAVYEEAGTVVDETEVGSYRFATRAADDDFTQNSEVVERRLQGPPGSVRVAVWNVSQSGFARRSEDFGRVLAALTPHVLLLDELPIQLDEEQLQEFLSSDSLGELGPWTFALGAPGVGQRAAVATRVSEVTPAVALMDVRYPVSSLERLQESVNVPWLDRILGLPVPRLSSAGARIDLGGTSVLFVAIDLYASGWAGSATDRMRVLEATMLRERIGAVLADAPGPVIIGGDLNLVGSRAPLFQLIQGLDVDGSDLTPVDAVRLGERTLATWRLSNNLFAPGRLDFLLVPDAAVTVANSFVFATEDLDDETLARLGLERDLMEGLSDHLVLVADLIFPSNPTP